LQGANREYIVHAVDELIELLGTKEDITLENLFGKFNSGNVKGCIDDIAYYLGLPINVTISYVSANNQSSNTADRFESSALTKAGRNNKEVSGITAQVDIPSNLPYYGSPEFQNFPIKVKISGDWKNDPAAFIPIMAHELSHVLLHSLRISEKNNEYYVDITGMILGFSEVIKDERDLITKIDTTQKGNYLYQSVHTSKFGYLNDDQFDCAINRINEIKQKYISLKSSCKQALDECILGIIQYTKEIQKFNSYLIYLDKRSNKKISREDSLKIVSFHQLDYVEGHNGRIANYEKKEQRIRQYAQNITHFTRPNFISLQNCYKEAKALQFAIIQNLNSLNQDVTVLEKYVGFIHKYRTNRR